MKKAKDITSVESKATFRERLLETFVRKNLPPQLPKPDRLAGIRGLADRFREVEYCAAETPVTGTVEIFFIAGNNDGLRRISFPVVSRFIVFCTRNSDHDYKVSWSCSLS